MGLLRGATVILGLVSISHVAISFTETIKASAPLFTVVFSYFILGERTSAPVIGTLLPVAVGLVVCSAYELDYDVVGLVAAVLNNCIACVQNVWSKKILSKGVLSPSQLQFFTSISAIALQMPLAIRMGTSTTLFTWSFLKTMDGIDTKLWQCILVNAVAYHLQSVSAFYTMSCMCPVSMSVANTTKRAIMIFLSILYFGNPVSGNTVVGMVLVMVGVFLYNHMRRMYPSMARK